MITTQVSGKYNNLSLIDLINKINNESIELEIKSADSKYIYKYKKNNETITEEREQKIIVFGKKDGLQSLNAEKIEELFIDITFKIIPKKLRPYKLLTISKIISNEDITKIWGFVWYKYQGKISYKRIISFLKDNFNYILFILIMNIPYIQFLITIKFIKKI